MKKSALSRQMPDIGRMDKEIVLQNATTSADAAGQMIETWATLATVWAMVEYKMTGDDERESGGKPTVFQTLEFTIRYRAGVSETTRVVYNSANYDILNIEEIGRQRFLLLRATKRQ